MFRIGSTMLALSLGTALVLLLTLTGKSSRGPIENFFSFTNNMAHNVEEKMIIEQRKDKRSDKLKWFDEYKNNPTLLVKPKSILVGAYDNNIKESFESVIDLEDTLHTAFPLIHIYSAWGSKSDQEFPAAQVKGILELGSLPIITWEPWLTAFDPDKYPQLKAVDKRDKGGLADIAKGTYDFYLKKWADDAKAVGKPIFLRVAHEMNDPYRYPWGPQNNSAKDFIAAWRHIHDVFKVEGATNIIWIWSPHPAYGFFKEFYPGDAYVDYVGVSALNYGTVASWSQWWSFKEIFGNYYAQLDSFKKPIIVTEFGCLNVGGNRGQWFADALDSLPQKYPNIRSVVFFHYSDDKTTTQQPIDWYIKNDTATTAAIRRSWKGWNKH